MEKKPKNLIIISIDNLRSDCIAANPHKELLEKYKLKSTLKTPILDWFVKHGTFYSNCIATAPYTTNSHASILTGQWPFVHGVQTFYGSKMESPTILSILKKYGYKTLFQTDKPLLLGESLNFKQNVDMFIEGNEVESFRWIKKNREEKLACFFHFYDLHIPYGFQKTGRDFSAFQKKTMQLLDEFSLKFSDYSWKNFRGITHEKGRQEKVFFLNYAQAINLLRAQGKFGEVMDLYSEGINYFEKKRFSKFITDLKKLGFLNDSLVVIVGDHGEAHNEEIWCHSSSQNIPHNTLVEELIRVPFILYAKGVKKGIEECNQVRTIDIVPTILALLGIQGHVEFFSGKSLIPTVDHDTIAYSQNWGKKNEPFRKQNDDRMPKKYRPIHEAYFHSASTRMNGYKYVETYDPNGKRVMRKFYDVSNGEKEIKAKDNKKIFTALVNKMSLYNSKAKKIHRNQLKREDVSEGEYVDKKQGIKSALKDMGYNV